MPAAAPGAAGSWGCTPAGGSMGIGAAGSGGAARLPPLVMATTTKPPCVGDSPVRWRGYWNRHSGWRYSGVLTTADICARPRGSARARPLTLPSGTKRAGPVDTATGTPKLPVLT